MIKNFNHVSFTVRNLNRSIDFYSNVLGLELIDKSDRNEEFSSSVTGIPGVKLKIAYFKTPNCFIELIEYEKGAGINIDTKTCNTGSSHICFNIDSFDDFITHLKKHNVKFSGQICIVPAGPNKGKKVLYIKDCDNNNIEFIEI